MKLSSTLLLLVFLASSASAQQVDSPDHHQNHKKDKLAWLQEKLELTAEQVEEIEVSLSERSSREEKKALFKEVLTPTQLATYQELRKHRKGHKGHKYHKQGHHKKHRIKDEEVRSYLIEMRTDFDTNLSETDKSTLEELRAEMHKAKKHKRAFKKNWDSKSEEEKQACKANWKKGIAVWKRNHKTLRQLKDKYEEELDALFEEHTAFFEAKRKEQKQRFEKASEQESGKMKSTHCTFLRNKFDPDSGYDFRHRREAFLLMQPDIPVKLSPIQEEIATSTLSISPNPASTMATLSYGIPSARKVRIELRDEQGRLVQVIENQNLDAGEYQKTLSTAALSSRLYLVSLWDGVELISEKLIVQK